MERSSRNESLFPNDRRNDRSPRARGTVLALGVLSILLLFTLRLASNLRGLEARASNGAHRATEPTAVPLERAGASASVPDERSARAPVAPELSATTAPAQEPAAAPDAARERLRKDLTSAVEASLSNALDPAAIVNSALALLHAHVEKGILPTTAPDGSLRYRLTPCPAGVQAELWVARSTGSKFEDVLSLRMKLAPPSEPYLLEGAVRKDPVAYVQAFLDASGRMKDLVIMTDIAPSGESRKFGLDVLQGRMPQGIIFHVDTSRPDDWKASAYGLDNGTDRTWDDPVAMLSDPRPEPDALGQLASGLLGLLSEARR